MIKIKIQTKINLQYTIILLKYIGKREWKQSHQNETL